MGVFAAGGAKIVCRSRFSCRYHMIPVAEALQNRCGSVARLTATQGRRRLRTGASAHREGGLCLRATLTLTGALWYHIRRGAWIRTPSPARLLAVVDFGLRRGSPTLVRSSFGFCAEVPEVHLNSLPSLIPSYPFITYYTNTLYLYRRVRLPYGVRYGLPFAKGMGKGTATLRVQPRCVPRGTVQELRSRDV